MTPESDELDLWWRVGLATIGLGYRALFHCRAADSGHIPSEGPALVASNHVSVLDPIAIALATASRGRAIRFLALADAFAHPMLGPGLRLLGQIPVRRGLRDLAALRELTTVLEEGRLAGIFPEGRVGDGASVSLRGRSGMVRVASATGVPILPVGLWGTQNRWPRGGPRVSRPFRTQVYIAFGDPIQVPAQVAATPGAIREATARIMEAIGKLAGRAREAQEARVASLLRGGSNPA